jgi:hypothetical protein
VSARVVGATASFRGKGENLLVAIVFRGAGRQVGVDVEATGAGGRALKGTMFRGRVGRGCSICETRAVALAILLPRPFLDNPDLSVLSWGVDSLVLTFHKGVSSRMQQFLSERRLSTTIRDSDSQRQGAHTSAVLPPVAVDTKSCTSRDR